ncbi:MAG: sterol desaturase family protein, partial [Pseudomonadota bacterium]
MEFEWFITRLVSPLFYVALPTQRVFGLYLLGALALAYLVYRSQKRASGGEGGFWRFCFPREVYAHPSAIADYKYFLVNKAFFALVLSYLIVNGEWVASGAYDGLVAAFGEGARDGGFSFIGAAALTLGAVTAIDFAIFLSHYLQHKVPFLWRFHKVHHSAEVMTPLTAYRMHPVDEWPSMTLAALLSGAVAGASAYVWGG